MSKIVSVDVETTGLAPERHEIWEVGIVPVDSGREPMWYQFQPTELERSDPKSLQVGGFYERFDWLADPRLSRDMLVEGVVDDAGEDGATGYKAVTSAVEVCWRIAKELEGATLLGLNVGSFDAPFLAALLRKYGHSPTWSHRYLDLGSYAAGAWGAKNVLSGSAVAERMEARGVVNDELHNAYTDARWNVDAYQAIRDGVGQVAR